MRSLVSEPPRHFLILLFYGLIGAALLAPIASSVWLPNILDVFNHIAMVVQAKMAIAEGQFPIRIAPLEHWNYPNFQFYSPTTYTIAGILYQSIIANPYSVIKLLLWISFVMGGTFMYRLAYWFVRSHVAALLAGVVYLTAPYYIVAINHFSAFNEAIALGLLPMVIYYSLQYYLMPRLTIFFILSFLWYLLITIHLITFIYASFSISLLLFFVTLNNRHHWKKLFGLGFVYLFGCLLAAWYLMPVSWLSNYLLVSDAYASSLMGSHITLAGFLTPGASLFRQYAIVFQSSQPSLGLPFLFGAGIVCYALFNKLRLRQCRANYWVPYFLMIFMLAFLLAWSPFDFLRWFPKMLSVGQYTGRYLGQVMWSASLLFAWALCFLFNDKLESRHLVTGLIIVLMATNMWFVTTDRDNVEFFKNKKPFALALNEDAYLIYPKSNPNLINKIDSIVLRDTKMTENVSNNSNAQSFKNTLTLDFISPATFFTASNLFLVLQGAVADMAPEERRTMVLFLNNEPVGSYDLKPGKFSWKISNDILQRIKRNPIFVFDSKFINVTKPNDGHSKLKIAINKIILGSFLNPTTTISATEVEKHCKKQNQETVCKLVAPKAAELMELPIMYYPNMMEITLNGKIVPYHSVMYEGALIASIKPIPGVENTVRVRFTGLMWANYISRFTWIIWLSGLLVFIVIRFANATKPILR